MMYAYLVQGGYLFFLINLSNIAILILDFRSSSQW